MEKQSTKTERIAAIIFLIIGVITVLEYVLVQGMFTAPIVIFLSIVAGLANIVIAFANKKFMNVLFYALLTVALNMGYFMIGGY
ncbi:MAG TPA: hypothetical protein VJZ01_10020 [Lachnospiraceae bacterium]|nr:hypothetical protein [Lachnospiraceae bacterium]